MAVCSCQSLFDIWPLLTPRGKNTSLSQKHPNGAYLIIGKSSPMLSTFLRIPIPFAKNGDFGLTVPHFSVETVPL
jgi:hypothetical protein